ncbi:MAG: glycosyltransferase, partial [Chloroflexota bacterium]
MAERPSISIIIPARNEQDYIGAALASIARQTYPPDRLECIVVDNGSSDGTAEQVRAVQEVARHELKLAYEPEPGTARAKNRGSQEATGDILLFLDADSQLGENLLSAVSRSRQQGVPASSIRIVADSHNLLERGYFALMQVGPTLFGVRGQM